MSDYNNLREENIRLTAEIERLKAELAEAKKPEKSAAWVTWPEVIPPTTFKVWPE